MADTQDKDKNQQQPGQNAPTGQQQSGQQGQQQSGNQPEKTGQQPQQKTSFDDSSKKNPSQGGQNEEQDQTGQRRAS